MQLMITGSGTGRTRVLHLDGWRLLGIGLVSLVTLLVLAAGLYHFILLKSVREGWPVLGTLVRLAVQGEFAQRDRYVRDNLDAMAQRIGEIEARMVRLQIMGERVSGLAGLRPDELRPAPATVPAPAPDARSVAPPGATPASSPPPTGTPPPRPGIGGPFLPFPADAATPMASTPWPVAEGQGLSVALASALPVRGIEALIGRLDGLQVQVELFTDVVTLAESRLLESRLEALRLPSLAPVDGPVGSGFGFRIDPFSGRPALHAGLDFPAEPGTPILAAADGLVVTREDHPAYGSLLEIDHGNGIVTRYAHCQSIDVQPGDLVRRGQQVARVGSTGRSTGPHLHFEVLVQGVPHNPARFLAGQRVIGR